MGWEEHFGRVIRISGNLLSRCPRVGEYPEAEVFPRGMEFESEADNLVEEWRRFKESFREVLAKDGLSWDDLFKAYITLIRKLSEVSSEEDFDRLHSEKEFLDTLALAGRFYPRFFTHISHPLVFSKILPAIHPENTKEYVEEAKILASLIGLALLRKRIEEVGSNVIRLEDLLSTVRKLRSYHFEPLNIS